MAAWSDASVGGPGLSVRRSSCSSSSSRAGSARATTRPPITSAHSLSASGGGCRSRASSSSACACWCSPSPSLGSSRRARPRAADRSCSESSARLAVVWALRHGSFRTPPAAMSWHGLIHGVLGAIVFVLMPIVLAFVYLKRFGTTPAGGVCGRPLRPRHDHRRRRPGVHGGNQGAGSGRPDRSSGWLLQRLVLIPFLCGSPSSPTACFRRTAEPDPAGDPCHGRRRMATIAGHLCWQSTHQTWKRQQRVS